MREAGYMNCLNQGYRNRGLGLDLKVGYRWRNRGDCGVCLDYEMVAELER